MRPNVKHRKADEKQSRAWLAPTRKNDLSRSTGRMKQNRITVAAMLASLLPTASAMAHSEVTAESGILAAVHHLVHALQANPLLPAIIAGVVIAVFAISRINKRES
jgi:H+/gluconate symporter-like permease